MKQLLAALICVLFACSVPSIAQDKKVVKATSTFYVEAMDCDHCIKKIEKNISYEKGVTDLKCDLSTRTAVVNYRSDKTSEVKLVAAFKKLGMDVVAVENGAGCPVSADKKSESGHKH